MGVVWWGHSTVKQRWAPPQTLLQATPGAPLGWHLLMPFSVLQELLFAEHMLGL